MRTFRVAVALGLLALGLAGPRTAGEPPAPSVEVRVVKYPELGETIRRLRGKVVVVDFWADY
jgi:hypothetical protein